MTSANEPLDRLLRAAAFAARAHRHQLRKDGRTPYVSHVFRVCLTVRHVFGVDDDGALTAALLHDTIEDTATDYDDIEREFGGEVAEWVKALTKDMREREPEREEKYKKELAQAPWQVQVCKLADIHDNLLDSEHFSPPQRAKTFRRSRGYLEALTHPDERVRRAYAIVARLLNELDPRIV
jgi:guanosine-3',5'-bis(diphosphate) 3'-pyrophosphohydrolase